MISTTSPLIKNNDNIVNAKLSSYVNGNSAVETDFDVQPSAKRVKTNSTISIVNDLLNDNSINNNNKNGTTKVVNLYNMGHGNLINNMLKMNNSNNNDSSSSSNVNLKLPVRNLIS